MRFVPFKFFYLGGYLVCSTPQVGSSPVGRSGPPVDGPKDPWPRVLSLPERFVGDPASLARDNIFDIFYTVSLSVMLIQQYTMIIPKHGCA